LKLWYGGRRNIYVKYKYTYIRPRVGIAIGVGDGQDVPVDELLQGRVGNNLLHDSHADGGSDPFTGVDGAVDPDGLLAWAGGNLEGVHVTALGGKCDFSDGGDSGVGIGQLVHQSVDLFVLHVPVVDSSALLAGELLLQGRVLSALPQHRSNEQIKYVF